jgi:hypothetical protein
MVTTVPRLRYRVARWLVFKPKISIWEGPRLENVNIFICPFGIFYGDLGYFMTIWYILYSFGTFCIHLVHFSGFGIMHQEKSGNPASLGLN